MTNEQTSALAESIAIEIIVHHLADMMVPANEARMRALANKAVKSQDWLRVYNQAIECLYTLEMLGYTIAKTDSRECLKIGGITIRPGLNGINL